MTVIGGVVLVVAFFLTMLFLGIGPAAQVHRAPGVDRQLPAIAPD